MSNLLLTTDDLAAARAMLVVVLGTRGLPFAVYLIARRATSVTVRLGALGFCASLAFSLSAQGVRVFQWLSVGLLYYGACAGLLHWVSKEARPLRARSAVAVFAMTSSLFLLLPSYALPTSAVAGFLFIGWELTLKGYSYVVEGGARHNDLKSCLFFFLVDPTIVFPQRGRADASTGATFRGAARFAAGVVALSGVVVAGTLLEKSVAPGQLLTAGVWLTHRVPYGAGRLLLEYGKQSGVASLQIGLMRISGFTVSERYNYPLLATSPADFWARWNVYVGQWARRYLYFPLALRAARAPAGVMRNLGVLASIMATFLSIGLLHDVYRWLLGSALSLSYTWLFLASGALVVVWLALARASVSDQVSPRIDLAARLRAQSVPQLLTGIAFLCLLGQWMLSQAG